MGLTHGNGADPRGSSAPTAIYKEASCKQHAVHAAGAQPQDKQNLPGTKAWQETHANVHSGYLWTLPGLPSGLQQGSAHVFRKGPAVSALGSAGHDPPVAGGQLSIVARKLPQTAHEQQGASQTSRRDTEIQMSSALPTLQNILLVSLFSTMQKCPNHSELQGCTKIGREPLGPRATEVRGPSADKYTCLSQHETARPSNGGNRVRRADTQELSGPSARFSCKPKTVVRDKLYAFFKFTERHLSQEESRPDPSSKQERRVT